MASVLIIDDNAIIRDAISAIVTRAGHAAQSATDGKEALKRFQTSRPDVVVTDVVMPRQDGIDTIRALRRLAPEVPIIAMSGSGNLAGLDFLDVALSVGAVIGLQKPFRAARLLSAIEAALGGSPVQPSDPRGSHERGLRPE